MLRVVILLVIMLGIFMLINGNAMFLMLWRRYAKCRHAVCQYAECRGALFSPVQFSEMPKKRVTEI